MELKITIVQTDLTWEDKVANLQMLDQKLEQISPSDLIVLPEMFTTGFSMNAVHLAEDMHGKSIQWMIQQAKEKQAVLTGSLIINENEQYFNRMLWVQPDGTIEYYDKRHLFGMANESSTYTSGQQHKIVQYKNWKIALFICYDLRFPVWNRNSNDYDLAIYVANWPARRSAHWKALLQARAIENQAYVVAVNRVGKDANGFEHSGDSSLIDPAGQIIYQKAWDEEIYSCVLRKETLKEIREKLPFLVDRDTFQIID